MRVRVSAVFEQAGEILCMRYVYGGKDVYAIPGGGVDRDVPFKEAIVAEWKNELGVKLEVGNVILLGEAPASKRHPQTLHVIFEALDVHGTPKVRSEHTSSLEVKWLPAEDLDRYPLYPDVGKYLKRFFMETPRITIPFIANCMERGFW